MPASLTNGLTTDDKVIERMNLTTSVELSDLVNRLIAGVSEFVYSYTGRRFKRDTFTNEVYDGSDLINDNTRKQYLVLKNAPIVSITSFQYRTGAKSNPTWVDFQADDYEEMDNLGIIRMNGGLPAGWQNIRISYTAGYLIDFTDEYESTVHTLPHDISDLAERLVIKAFKKRESEGRSQESFDASSVTWSAFLDAHDKIVLANYSRSLALLG